MSDDMPKPHIEITEEDANVLATSRGVCFSNWRDAAQKTLSRLEKMSFKKMRDAGLAGEDYPVLKNAVEMYVTYLQNNTRTDQLPRIEGLDEAIKYAQHEIDFKHNHMRNHNQSAVDWYTALKLRSLAKLIEAAKAYAALTNGGG